MPTDDQRIHAGIMAMSLCQALRRGKGIGPQGPVANEEVGTFQGRNVACHDPSLPEIEPKETRAEILWTHHGRPSERPALVRRSRLARKCSSCFWTASSPK